MKFRTKLLYSFTVNCLILITVGTINITFILNSQNNLNNLTEIIFVGDKHIDRLNLVVNQLHGDILSLLLNPDAEKSTVNIDYLAVDFYSELDALGRIFPEDISSFQGLKGSFQEFYLYGKWIYSLPDLSSLQEYPDAIRKFLEQKNTLIIESDRIFVKYERIFIEKFDSFNRQVSFILYASIIVVIIGVLLSFFLSILLANSLSRPVRELIETLNEVEKGNLLAFSEIKSKDEIGQLSKALNKMSSNLEASFNKLRENKDDLQYFKSLLQSILDSVRSVVIAVDNEMRVTHWNIRAEEFIGLTSERTTGTPLFDLLPKSIFDCTIIEPYIKRHEQRDFLKVESIINNENRYLNVNIFPHKNSDIEGAVIVIEDITEHNNMEEMMVQNEKMLSVGGLAAGMAHEINNPLAGMIQTAGVMSNRLDKNIEMMVNVKAAEEAGTTVEAIRKFMKSRGILRMTESINESGRRVADIVDNMLSFARKSDHRKSSHSLEELMERALTLAGTDYNLKIKYDFKHIRIEKYFENNLPLIPCEETKILQVLLNILNNGAQAMQYAGTGDPQFIIRIKLGKDRTMVCLEIEDNGPGMDEAIQKRIFEPFFTTKPTGSGTGLGLSVSYFIIRENHKGELMVKSQPGRGSIFYVNLPV